MERLLMRIANLLYINMQYVADNSLLKGKMGLTLFFYEYGRYSGNTIYTDTADLLLDEIIESLSSNENDVLAGIGWGIQYLIKNKFVEGDPDEVLAEIDERMQQVLENQEGLQIEKYRKIIAKNNFSLSMDGYILSRVNSKVRNVENVRRIVDFYQNMLLTADVQLPISFLNTCYAFISSVCPLFIGVNDMAVFGNLLDKQYRLLFANKLYNDGDLKFLMRIRRESEINLPITENASIGYCGTIDSYLHYFIPELLYFDSDYHLPNNQLIDNYVNEIINHISSDNLSINGLAGVGLMMIKKRTLLYSKLYDLHRKYL